jgi:hypothetical protein
VGGDAQGVTFDAIQDYLGQDHLVPGLCWSASEDLSVAWCEGICGPLVNM